MSKQLDTNHHYWNGRVDFHLCGVDFVTVSEYDYLNSNHDISGCT